ncbi:phosphoribosylformylglycinamidine cyclo-ligase [Thermoplasmatales archaeon SW_10_69_26]|nr:MAG: phosphoribosylformylglycinamidine cyclo-ligase [Thermoplasmatales archaeon SW_10_69_26]
MAEDDEGLTYADAGVDIAEEAATVESLVGELTTGREGPVQPVDVPGHFAGAVRLGDVALVMCTDGVGSKVVVADALGDWSTIGIDCLAMNVNDAVCLGAEPVAFVDYLALEEHREGFAEQIGAGLAAGARQANVAILGGETATLPDVVQGFDIAGTCLAQAPADDMVTGEAIEPGDTIVGLPSSGIHSNGLTLAREAMAEADIGYRDTVPEVDRAFGEELLEPTRLYVQQALQLVDRVDVHGLVHVTGGGVHNLPRMRSDVSYRLDDPPEPPGVFQAIARMGKVSEDELYQTFNMGVGFAAVVDEADVDEALEVWDEGFVWGQVDVGEGVAIPDRDLRFDPDP